MELMNPKFGDAKLLLLMVRFDEISKRDLLSLATHPISTG
jgi:hypothetical protein